MSDDRPTGRPDIRSVAKQDPPPDREDPLDPAWRLRTLAESNNFDMIVLLHDRVKWLERQQRLTWLVIGLLALAQLARGIADALS